jgi:hypothetical protein
VERYGRRILLAVEPGLLQGALAKLLAANAGNQIVEVGRVGLEGLDQGYHVAIVSDQLPQRVQAGVVITLPDTRGSGGTGTVRIGEVVHEVTIWGAERVVELLEQYVPDR